MATNNEAKYKALIKGLRKCKCVKHCKGEVEHFTDSKLVAKQASGEWMVRAPNLKLLVEEVFRTELQFSQVTYRHVARTDPKIQRIDGIVNRKFRAFLQ